LPCPGNYRKGLEEELRLLRMYESPCRKQRTNSAPKFQETKRTFKLRNRKVSRRGTTLKKTNEDLWGAGKNSEGSGILNGPRILDLQKAGLQGEIMRGEGLKTGRQCGSNISSTEMQLQKGRGKNLGEKKNRQGNQTKERAVSPAQQLHKGFI